MREFKIIYDDQEDDGFDYYIDSNDKSDFGYWKVHTHFLIRHYQMEKNKIEKLIKKYNGTNYNKDNYAISFKTYEEACFFIDGVLIPNEMVKRLTENNYNENV